MNDKSLSVTIIKRHCLECSGGSKPAVIWCQCHGVGSERCHLWPYRFGVQPGTFRAKYGDRLLTPELMPDAAVDLDVLPGTLTAAATGEIDVEGYHQPAVAIERRPAKKMTDSEKQALRERFRRGKAAKQDRAA